MEEKIKIVQCVSKNALIILVDEISRIQSLAGSSYVHPIYGLGTV